MEHEKQYNLLRPFNKEQAQDGKPICCSTGEAVQYVAGPDVDGDVCVWFGQEYLYLIAQSELRMAPLTWVEGQPVYAGDVLYWNNKTSKPGSKFTVGSKMLYSDMIEGVSVLASGKVYDMPETGMVINHLTWNAPQQVQTIKLVAFIDDQGTLRWVREDVYRGGFTRVPTEDKNVEVNHD